MSELDTKALRFADVGVTATAKEFAGIYRGKQQHVPDLDAVLDRAVAAGVDKILLTGMSLSDVDFNLEICRRRPGLCYMTVGVHPYHANEPEDGGSGHWESLKSRSKELLQETPSPVKAFGELGLDYDRLNHASKEVQIRIFKAQLDLAIKEQFDVPLFLHCRNAFSDFVEIITPYLPKLPHKGLVHSFVGTKDEMRALTSLGLDISVNGFSFQSPESIEMVKAVPLERLHLETDAPWGYISPNSELAKKFPSPIKQAQSKKRDKFEMGLMVKERNESCAIGQVAAIAAGLKEIGIGEVAKAARENSEKLFKFDA